MTVLLLPRRCMPRDPGMGPQRFSGTNGKKRKREEEPVAYHDPAALQEETIPPLPPAFAFAASLADVAKGALIQKLDRSSKTECRQAAAHLRCLLRAAKA